MRLATLKDGRLAGVLPDGAGAPAWHEHDRAAGL